MIRTRATLKVAAALLAGPAERHYGYELCRATGVRPGTVYPILTRLCRDGVLDDGWQLPDDTKSEQRMPRRYYTLTDEGRDRLRALIDTEVTR